MEFPKATKAGKTAKAGKDPLNRHQVIQFECRYAWPKGQEQQASEFSVTKECTVTPGPGWGGVSDLVKKFGKDASGVLCGALVEAVEAYGGSGKLLADLKASESFFLSFDIKTAKKKAG